MDVSNGTGIRVSLFVQGCEFRCKGCFNQETWNFNNGKEWTDEVQKQFINLGKKDYVEGFTILGGEPLHPQNRDTVARLIHDIKTELPDKTIWVYSGYTYEYLLKNCYYTLVNIDVLVDGQFIEELKDFKYPWAGSTNQRVINVKKSLDIGEIVLLEN